jgi:hypothetical protein
MYRRKGVFGHEGAQSRGPWALTTGAIGLPWEWVQKKIPTGVHVFGAHADVDDYSRPNDRVWAAYEGMCAQNLVAIRTVYLAGE